MSRSSAKYSIFQHTHVGFISLLLIFGNNFSQLSFLRLLEKEFDLEYEIDVDKKLGILISTSTGKWNIEDSDRVTQELINASIEHDIRKVLIDHSKVKINISRYLALKRPSELKSQFEDIFPRVAFVSPKRNHQIYQFFTLIAQNKGILFQSFKKKKDAIEWLLQGNE